MSLVFIIKLSKNFIFPTFSQDIIFYCFAMACFFQLTHINTELFN